MNHYPSISTYIAALESESVIISIERKGRLDKILGYINTCQQQQIPALLTFICTHNSRRSHFGQIWAKTLADYYDIPHVSSYSGGTESTAFHPNAVRALRAVGFVIEKGEGENNPLYLLHYGKDFPPLKAWSKVYDDPANPQQDFCAIMTCSEADEACPIVVGASVRISLPFEDPKKADGTDVEAETYLTRCKQIAAELNYVFRKLANTV